MQHKLHSISNLAEAEPASQGAWWRKAACFGRERERERENFSARKLQVAGSAPPAEEKQEVRRMLRILLCRERSFLVFDILGSGGVVVVEEIWGKSS